ncbi:Murein DD-endopeptidase MepM [compost metagenome]
MARHIPTLTEGQVVGFNSLRNENETLQKEMDIASLSPFDTSSRYTLLGSMVHTMQMGVLTSGNYDGSPLSMLSSLAQLPQSLLTSKVSAADYTENSCSYADSFDLSSKDGAPTPALNMAGLPCTGITPEQAAMSTAEATTIMINKGWIDGSKDVPDNATPDDLLALDIIKKDTPLSAYMESCSDASTGDYIIDAPGCTVKSSVTSGQPTTDDGWSTDQYCKNDKGENTCGDAPATPVPQAEDTRAFAAMAVFLLDFQEVQMITGQDEEEAGSSSSSSATLENSGKINPEGWAYPLDSPKTLVTYDKHNGDDISTPIGSKVYSMRDGTVIATETQSVAEMEALAFCPAFARITGPQKNLMIESTVDGKKYTIRYAHLSEFKVKVGDTVKAGDVVALSGNTGCVDTSRGDGAHLHVDINAGEIYPRDIFGTSF